MKSIFVDVENRPWEKTAFPGVETKTLLFEKKTGLLTVLLRMAPGVKLPDHEHVEIEQTYVLEGSLICPEGECRAGQFVWRPAGSRHGGLGRAAGGPDARHVPGAEQVLQVRRARHRRARQRLELQALSFFPS